MIASRQITWMDYFRCSRSNLAGKIAGVFLAVLLGAAFIPYRCPELNLPQGGQERYSESYTLPRERSSASACDNGLKNTAWGVTQNPAKKACRRLLWQPAGRLQICTRRILPRMETPFVFHAIHVFFPISLIIPPPAVIL